MLELSLEEQETSIYQMADNRDVWGIVTSDKVWQARLKKMGFKPVREKLPTQWFEIPATCVIVRKAPNVKPKTPEQIERARASMAAMQARKRAQKEQDSE